MNQVNYIHLRNHLDEEDDDGNLLLDNFGGATLAYDVSRIADELRIAVAVAECVDTDRFVKRIGRDIASSRLRKGGNALLVELVIPAQDEEHIESLVVEEYYKYKETFWPLDEEIRVWLYPHRPGYSLSGELTPTEVEVVEAEVVEVEDDTESPVIY